MPKIIEIYAFIAEDTCPEDEGLVAGRLGKSWWPLVGADKDRVKSLRVMAKDIVDLTGKPVKLVRFTHREELETIKP